MTRLTASVIALGIAAALPLFAQAPAPASAAAPVATAADVKAAPALTDVQKLTVQNLAQQLENAQLRAQLAQADFDRARQAIAELVKSLQVEGYELDLQTFTYLKKPDPKAAAPNK